MAAALLLVSESVLATVRSDFAEVAVINGTVSTQVTPAASSCSMDEADGCGMGGSHAKLLDGAVLSCSMDGAVPLCSMVEADAQGIGGCAPGLLGGVALADCWWELGGLAMAEFYSALRELPDLQADLRFPTGRTKSCVRRVRRGLARRARAAHGGG